MSSDGSYEHGRDYEQYCDFGDDCSSVSNTVVTSESSEGYYSIYEQSSIDYNEDDISSSDFYFYENDSSYDDFRSDSSIAASRSPEENTNLSSEEGGRKEKPPLNGILKRTRGEVDNYNTEINNNDSTTVPISITQAVIDKIRETELEDVLQYARDIINPDPSAQMTFSYQPAKVVQGSFRHLLSVKEIFSKTGAFKYRTIEIHRNGDGDLGFSVRQGDGWEKQVGIYISRVSLGSIFDQYEILTVGDQIMQINKVDVTKMNVEDVIRLMHIPERLLVTIKMLTPFSKKRVEKSGIHDNKNVKQKKILSVTNCENTYKVAQMKIGSSDKRHVVLPPKRAILVNHKNNEKKDKKTMRISPYRTMEGGGSVPTSCKHSPVTDSGM